MGGGGDGALASQTTKRWIDSRANNSMFDARGGSLPYMFCGSVPPPSRLSTHVFACAVLLFLAQCAWFPGLAEAHIGFGAVVDRQGRVVFLDSGASRVWRIETDGRLTVLAEGKHADNLVTDAAGNLYVESFNQELWKIAPGGGTTRVDVPRWRSDVNVGSLDELIAIDGEGNLYLSGQNEFYEGPPQIRKVAPGGEATILAGGAAGHADGKGEQARFGHLRAAAWGGDGALFVTDENCVRRVAPDGTVTTVAGNQEAGFVDGPAAGARFQRVLGLCVDAAGNIFVADHENARLRKITPGGEVLTVLVADEPWKPIGVAEREGVVYVVEARAGIGMALSMFDWRDTRRVRRIAADGGVTTVASVGGGFGGVVFLAGAGAVLVFVVWMWRRRRRRVAIGAAE
jgi:sugar lactone lactonase YvrE